MTARVSPYVFAAVVVAEFLATVCMFSRRSAGVVQSDAGIRPLHALPRSARLPRAATGPDGGRYFTLLHLHSVGARSQPFEHKSQECFPTSGGVNVHVERP